MYRKTESSNVVTNIHEFGPGLAYTNVLFIQDKWTECSVKQSYIPSNFQKGQMVTQVSR